MNDSEEIIKLENDSVEKRYLYDEKTSKKVFPNEYSKYVDAFMDYEDKLKELGKNDRVTKEALKKVEDIEKKLNTSVREYLKKNRSEEFFDVIEARALNTQEDYQKEYDRLSKLLHTLAAEGRKIDEEIKKADDIRKKKTEVCNRILDKLLDIEREAKAKGFKLNVSDKRRRSFETTDNIELRALKTKKDYQKEYDKVDEEFEKAHDELTKVITELRELEKKRSNNYKVLQGIRRRRWDLEDEAKAKGFKLKIERSFETTDTIELRALETEKDYQKKIDEWAEQVQDQLDRANTAKENWQYWLDEAKADVASMEKIYKEGVKKGFKLKKKSFKIRSFDADFESRKNDIVNSLTGFDERKAGILLEYRALETQEDYQKEYDRLKKEYDNAVKEWKKADKEWANAQNICDSLDDKKEKLYSVMGRLYDEKRNFKKKAMDKGFRLKD